MTDEIVLGRESVKTAVGIPSNNVKDLKAQ